jgi:hypothetical protein
MVSGLEQIKELHDLYWDNNEVSDFRSKIESYKKSKNIGIQEESWTIRRVRK